MIDVKWANFTMGIERAIDAPRAVVFGAWTDARQLAQWWGPQDFTNPVCEIEATPSGRIHIDMRAPDGTIFPMSGVVEEIVEGQRLVFRSSPLDGDGKPLFEVRTSVAFAGEGGRTTLTLDARVLSTEPGSMKYIEGMQAGWTQTIDRLETHAMSMRTTAG